MPPMPSPVPPRCLLLSSVALAAIATSAGCAGDCDTVEPVYAGEATDEAWREMLDARIDADDGADAATFTAPAAGQAVPASASPAFAWESPLKVVQAPAPPGAPRPAGPWRRRAPSLLDRIVGAVVPSAHAHLPPITSDVYLLEVDVPGRSCPVAALTTELSFTFDEQGWTAIAAGGGERIARLLSAFLTDNNVTEGPFLAAPLTFTIDE
jgi:hypothetical protein